MLDGARARIVSWLDRTSAQWWPDDRADSSSGGSPLEITKLIGIAFRIAVVAAVVQGCIHYFNGLVLDFRIQMFKPEEDGGVFTWASSVATAIAANAFNTLCLPGKFRMIGNDPGLGPCRRIARR